MTPIKGRLSVKGTKASGAQIGLVTPITILRAKSQWSGATWGKLLLVPLSLSAVTALFMIWSWCSITLNLCRKCLIREVRVSAKHDSLLPRFVSRSWAAFGVFVNGNVSHCPAILVYWYIIWCPQSEFFLYLRGFEITGQVTGSSTYSAVEIFLKLSLYWFLLFFHTLETFRL